MPEVLVMTSGNPSGAPICMTDAEAEKYLAPMCDEILSDLQENSDSCGRLGNVFLSESTLYDSPVQRLCALPTVLPQEYHHSVLGIGGELKNTFGLLRGDMNYMSPYIGDMADVRSVEALELAEERLERLLEITLEAVVCDLHPKYNTGEVARKLAEEKGIPCMEVQHHYAHVLSCMAENEWDAPVIGVSFDGTGFGTDGTDLGRRVPALGLRWIPAKGKHSALPACRRGPGIEGRLAYCGGDAGTGCGGAAEPGKPEGASGDSVHAGQSGERGGIHQCRPAVRRSQCHPGMQGAEFL